MKADIVFTHQALEADAVQGKIAIVIDVLRATTVIATALYHGYKALYPVAEPEAAFALKKKYPTWHLAGERQADKIKGFDFSNSPTELISTTKQKDTLVLCTTNGTQALAKTTEASKVYSLAFVNLQAVAQSVAVEQDDVLIVCSGTHGQLSLDDNLAAGFLLNELDKTTNLQTNDTGLMLMQWAQSVDNIEKALQQAKHYNTLIKKGLKKDIDVCLSLNTMPIVPIWHQNHFTL